jgi:nonsense-mediated mRNA decay protein 3
MIMFCVECGKEGKTYDGLCASCHLARRRFVSLPEILDVQVCGSCFATRIGKKWVDALNVERAIRLAVEESLEKERSVTDAEIKLKLTQRDSRNYLADATVVFSSGDFNAEKEFKINIRLKKDTCQRCGKKSGHYYEAIIQLRGPQDGSVAKRLTDAREELLSKVEKLSRQNREFFISREEKVSGGYDFYASSSSVAKSIAKDLSNSFGASSKASSSLVGKKDGQDLTRMTYLIRLPEYSKGDTLLIDGRHYLLRSFEGSTLSLTDLLTWQESNMTVGRLSEIEIAARREDILATKVVSDSEHKLRILDPETRSPVDIAKPKKFGASRDVVSFVKTKKGLLLIP